MTTNIERAADVIDRWSRNGGELNSHVGNPDDLAQALADAGLLMPDPAKPAVTSIEGYHTYHPWAIWHAEGLTINRDHEGTIYIDDEAGRNISMSPEQARALIGALLAAAHHAEQEQA